MVLVVFRGLSLRLLIGLVGFSRTGLLVPWHGSRPQKILLAMNTIGIPEVIPEVMDYDHIDHPQTTGILNP